MLYSKFKIFTGAFLFFLFCLLFSYYILLLGHIHLIKQRDDKSKRIIFNNYLVKFKRKYLLKRQWEDAALKDKIILKSKLIRERKNDSNLYFERGKLYLKMREYRKANLDFKETICLDPGNFNAYYYLGESYREIFEIKESLRCFQKAETLNKKQSKLFFAKGYCYYLLEDFKKAENEYEYGMEISDSKEDKYKYYLLMSDILFSQYKEDEAIELINKAMNINHNNPKAYIRLALLCMKNPKMETYVPILLSKALSFDPYNVKALQVFGEYYYRLRGKPNYREEAIFFLKKALIIDKGNYRTNCLIARVYESYMTDRAIHYYTKAIISIEKYSTHLLDDTLAEIYYKRGKCYIKCNQRKLAIKDFNETSRLDPKRYKTFIEEELNNDNEQ